MLKTNQTYYHTELEKNVFLYDYVYYGGTNEHAFTFDYGKEIVKSNNIEMFLLKIQDITPINKAIMREQEVKLLTEKESNNYSEMQNVLLETIKGLKNGTITPEQGKSIAMVAQALISSVKVEKLLK